MESIRAFNQTPLKLPCSATPLARAPTRTHTRPPRQPAPEQSGKGKVLGMIDTWVVNTQYLPLGPANHSSPRKPDRRTHTSRRNHNRLVRGRNDAASYGARATAAGTRAHTHTRTGPRMHAVNRAHREGSAAERWGGKGGEAQRWGSGGERIPDTNHCHCHCPPRTSPANCGQGLGEHVGGGAVHDAGGANLLVRPQAQVQARLWGRQASTKRTSGRDTVRRERASEICSVDTEPARIVSHANKGSIADKQVLEGPGTLHVHSRCRKPAHTRRSGRDRHR